MLLQGRTAVVTGASSGIGRSVVQTLAKNGCHIWACSRTSDLELEDWYEQLKIAYHVQILVLYFDISSESELKEALKKIYQSTMKIDILINNAGKTPENKSFMMTSIEQMKDIFNVNFFSQMLITQYISRLMIKQRSGAIVNVASIAGIDGGPGQLEYVSSKAAIIGATKKISEELAPYNIRVNAIAPGVTDTKMLSNMKEQLLEQSIARTNLKRVAQPDEIANAILFLCSDMSTYVTGQTIRVDGGIY